LKLLTPLCPPIAACRNSSRIETLWAEMGGWTQQNCV